MKALSMIILALGMMSANFALANCGCKHGDKSKCEHTDKDHKCDCAGKEGKEHSCNHDEHAGHEKKEEKK